MRTGKGSHLHHAISLKKKGDAWGAKWIACKAFRSALSFKITDLVKNLKDSYIISDDALPRSDLRQVQVYCHAAEVRVWKAPMLVHDPLSELLEAEKNIRRWDDTKMVLAYNKLQDRCLRAGH